MTESKVIIWQEGEKRKKLDVKTKQGKVFKMVLIFTEQKRRYYIYINEMLLKSVKERICHPKICAFGIRIILKELQT